MRRILTGVLSFHWLVVFGLLAGAALNAMPDGSLNPGGVAAPAGALWISSGFVCGALAAGFALVATLFLWMLVSVMTDEGGFPGDTDDIARIAFGAGIVMCTALMIVGAADMASWLLVATAVEFAALVVSYLVFQSDRHVATLQIVETGDEVSQAASRMALGAAHATLLDRLPGRVANGEAG